MSLTVKASLYHDWSSDPIETRRFSIDQDVVTNYTYLIQKLAQIFPDVSADNIIVTYRDSDGDRIVISSDDELTDALDQFDGTIFRLFIKKRSDGDKDTTNYPFHPPFFHHSPFWRHGRGGHGGRGGHQFFNHGPYRGHGYGRGGHWPPHHGHGGHPPVDPHHAHGGHPPVDPHHSQGEHPPVNPDQGEKPPVDPHAKTDGKGGEDATKRGPYHPGVVCDGCNGSIYGRRYKCTTCPDYDLCVECEGKGLHPDHNMYSFDEPRTQCDQGYYGGFLPGFLSSLFGTIPGVGGHFGIWSNPGQGGCPRQYCGSQPHCSGGYTCGPNSTNKTNTDDSMETEQQPKEAGNLLYAEVLEQLKGMGFEDEGGWLTELIRAKVGDLQKILDALHHGQTDKQE